MRQAFAVDLSTLAPTTAFDTFGDLVTIVIKNAVVLAGIISFLLLVFGGFGVIIGAGSGDTHKIEQGQKTIVGAVAGLIVIVTAVWIVQILEKLTGINFLTN